MERSPNRRQSPQQETPPTGSLGHAPRGRSPWRIGRCRCIGEEPNAILLAILYEGCLPKSIRAGRRPLGWPLIYWEREVLARRFLFRASQGGDNVRGGEVLYNRFGQGTHVQGGNLGYVVTGSRLVLFGLARLLDTILGAAIPGRCGCSMHAGPLVEIINWGWHSLKFELRRDIS